MLSITRNCFPVAYNEFIINNKYLNNDISPTCDKYYAILTVRPPPPKKNIEGGYIFFV